MRIRSRAFCGILGLLSLGIVCGTGETLSAAGNLLWNAAAEFGSGGTPNAWTPVTLPGGTGAIEFVWDDATAHGGARSLRISAKGSRRAAWQQTVPVQGGAVYTLCGYIALEDVDRDRGECRLQVVFRDADGGRLQIVDYPGHDGSRPFELDFSADLKFRAPAEAARAEIRGYLEGPGTAWFDDFTFAEAPAGEIVGRVTSGGMPVAGARVWIHGDPWGAPIETVSGIDGSYRLGGIPVAYPRYIVLAAKDGYRTVPQGEIAILENGSTTVDFELAPGIDPLDDLDVRYGFLAAAAFQEREDVPEGATIPADAFGYPPSVREYLESDAYITSDDPAIRSAASNLLASIPTEDRSDTRAVSWAVYAWVSRTFNHDAVFGNGEEAYRDVTSGIWQTIQDGGWCWGRNFYDWAYSAAEALDHGSLICVEHAWLCAALLRALNIPARARVGSAQFWAQTTMDDGRWIGMSTNGGSNTYREHGILGAGFGRAIEPVYTSVTSEPFLHEDWDLETPGLWHETHPWSETYDGSEDGLRRALADLEAFARTGDAPKGSAGRVPGAPTYQIHYSAVVINLYTVEEQRTLDVRFPMVGESTEYEDTEERAYWTNHPECVRRTWIEEIANPPVEGIQRWFHIEFDLSPLLAG